MKLTTNDNFFRNVYLVDDENAFLLVTQEYDPKLDIVYTFDFGLLKSIELKGGRCALIDHIIDHDQLQKDNFLIYHFFNKWYLRQDDSDVFTFNDISFGMAFRQEIWNDYTFYIRIRNSISKIILFKRNRLLVVSNMPLLIMALHDLSVEFEEIKYITTGNVFFFPIFKWNTDAIRTRNLRSFLLAFINATIITVQNISDIFQFSRSKPCNVFIQQYHPTNSIIKSLGKDKKIQLVLQNNSTYKDIKRMFSEHTIPLHGMSSKYKKLAKEMISEVEANRTSHLVLSNGDDVTEAVVRVLTTRIEKSVPDYIRMLDSIIHYFDRETLKLEILIANLGIMSSLIDAYCKQRNIPCYLIINGILAKNFCDESKYATVINSYSRSIRDNYFRGMDNVLTLGDPRMDSYAINKSKKEINRSYPTITIGSSGYNPTDLNSYLCVEFAFMYDVISALLLIRAEGKLFDIIVKVRPNGYKSQYEAFFKRFFSDFSVSIVDTVPMLCVLQKTDFYISIYSQTLFEASMMGIPVLYYKKDTETTNTPFDGKSELVTVDTIEGLVTAVNDFYADSSRYSAFLERSVMEKYIGPLDGKNLERNLNFIYKLLDCKDEKDVAVLINDTKTSQPA